MIIVLDPWLWLIIIVQGPHQSRKSSNYDKIRIDSVIFTAKIWGVWKKNKQRGGDRRPWPHIKVSK